MQYTYINVGLVVHIVQEYMYMHIESEVAGTDVPVSGLLLQMQFLLYLRIAFDEIAEVNILNNKSTQYERIFSY